MDNINNKQIGVYINSERMLTDFGKLFVNSCVPEVFSEM